MENGQFWGLSGALKSITAPHFAVCLHCEKSAPCDAAVCQNCLTTYIEDSALRIMLFNAIFRGKIP